jgi:thiosulfate/3-mercaptopyruvate sulfurtransferase
MESIASRPLPSLVSCQWLAAHLHDPDVVVLDCSWYLPVSGRDADAEYLMAHIPGAVRFDIDAVSATDTDLPHMLPSPNTFAAALERLGVKPTDRVVCYDGSGFNLSAARVWWMFRVFGHRTVAVLDGGFRAWTSATRGVQRSTPRREATGYPVPSIDHELVRSREDVERISAGAEPFQLVDCRPAARFRGQADEPRGGVSRGHVAGSSNVPFSELTDATTGLLLPPDRLASRLAAESVNVGRPVVAMCGSGVSAGVLALAVEVMREAGQPDVGPPVAIYDGSWSEWGRTA